MVWSLFIYRYTKEALHKILYRIFVEYGYEKIDKLQFIDNISLGSCSYFNLIPSCPTCNGFGAKEAKNTFYVYPISNPYTIKPIDFRFSIRPKRVEFIDNVKEEQYNFDDFEIDIYGNRANLDIFQLEKLYKQHTKI